MQWGGWKDRRTFTDDISPPVLPNPISANEAPPCNINALTPTSTNAHPSDNAASITALERVSSSSGRIVLVSLRRSLVAASIIRVLDCVAASEKRREHAVARGSTSVDSTARSFASSSGEGASTSLASTVP